MAQVNYIDALRSRILSPRRVSAPRIAVPARPGPPIDHSPLVELLENASDGWWVDYGAVRASSVFADYVASLAAVDPDALDPDDQLAFWINAYNAHVLGIVAGSRVASIIEIPRVFTALRVEAGGERLTLDEIEHAKVRRFGDYRIHYALNCASVGCPPLRAYDGPNLGDQMDANGYRYLADPRRGAAADSDTVRLSMVFRWFAGDFAPIGRMPSALGTIVSTLRPARVLPAARRHLPQPLRETSSVGFIPWDWSVNQKPT